ncbi:leucine Rich Repeat family protein [Aphelenchoides avenae]|nr:leucine Rich Repeat family protein [Aphelenchus avenae]
MDLSNADLAKTVECPVCLDVFDEPKFLNCGHTVCQKCVNKVVATRRNGANARQGRDRNCIKCPVCTTETEIPPDGLITNYSLVDLVCRVQKSLVDSHACNGCGKQAPVAEMFTCVSCEEKLNCTPLWICALCAMNRHRYHAILKCNKATRQQVQEACQGIAGSGGSADMYVRLTMSHLNRATKETELISQLLDQQKRGFERLQQGVKCAANDLTQEDLAASQQEATDLEHKFVQASTFASEAGKIFENALRDCRERLEDLFPKVQREESMETEASGASRNNFDLSGFDDGQETLELTGRRFDVIPDLARFTQLQSLSIRNNLLTSIGENTIRATLTRLILEGNNITEIHGLDALVNLESLSISFNFLKKIEGLSNLVKVKILGLKDNMIEKIEGLDTLVNLEELVLSGNRIKAIEGLDNQRNLRELCLAGNRIRKLENISQLTQLRMLSIGANRITKLENLDTLADLEELCVADQGIETLDGIQKLNKLGLIDVGKNSITSLDHLGHLQHLEQLHLNGNKITQWTEVEKLDKLENLWTVHLEGNPIETQNRDDYRRKVAQALPRVTELDDTPCR